MSKGNREDDVEETARRVPGGRCAQGSPAVCEQRLPADSPKALLDGPQVSAATAALGQQRPVTALTSQLRGHGARLSGCTRGGQSPLRDDARYTRA